MLIYLNSDRRAAAVVALLVAVDTKISTDPRIRKALILLLTHLQLLPETQQTRMLNVSKLPCP